jgi:histidinol-phosphate aminotransferase
MAVRLSSNESPFGPSNQAVEAMEVAARDVHRYPDDQSRALRAALAAHEGVSESQVAVGNGSAAILMDLVAQHVVAHGRGAVLAFERSFIVYRLAARNAKATYPEAPTAGPATLGESGYARDIGALLERIDDDTRLVMIDNPGNPTGVHLAGDDLRALVQAVPEHVTIVVDEAYHHFARGQRGYQTVAELELAHPRLLVTRTFSKAYALAGQRVGYALGPPELIAALDGFRTRFHVNAVAQAGALAALADQPHLASTVDRTIAQRDRITKELRSIEVPCTDSLGNFVTFEVGGDAGPVVDAFGQRSMGVRELAPYGMNEQVRVTAGTEDEVDQFLEVARVLLA